VFVKYSKLFLLLFFLITKLSSAMIWEFGIRVENSSHQPVGSAIYVYGYNEANRDFVELYSGYCSSTPIVDSWNAVFNVKGISGNYANALATLPYYTTYIFKVGNSYSQNTVDFGGSYVDMTMTYTEGTGWGSASNGSQSTGTWSMQTITLKNKMGNDYASVSGLIKLNAENITVGYSGIGKQREASTFPHTIYAENQPVGGVGRKWREWVEDGNQNISRT
jgi:hypothetical protein